MLSYEQARQKIIEAVGRSARPPAREEIALGQALGRVLAEPVLADRDYPPFDRSTRDGFAVRAVDVASSGAMLALIGEVKAGSAFAGTVGPGQCVQIMTGAVVPAGADAVVMLEYTTIAGKSVTFERPAERGQNIVPRGSESRVGQGVLQQGMRVAYAELGIAAQVGRVRLSVFSRPRLAILSTGDEVVEADQTPGPLQIRNSNGLSLAAQAAMAGADAVSLGNAPDEKEELRRRVLRGFEADLLVLSGGVSMGNYDLVKEVLAELDAEFFFDGVAIRPGRPAVFGSCRGQFFFGLPGNPVSTMVTFELFVLPAIDLLAGAAPRPLPLLRAKLAAPVLKRASLTHFLPARLDWPAGEPEVRELPWQGSGDSVALAQANCFLVVPANKLEWASGEWADVLLRRGVF